MIKKTQAMLFGIAVAVGLLMGCAESNLRPMEMSGAVQKASGVDHQALAAYFETAAKDAEAKVEEHRKLLEKYRGHSYE